MTSEFENPENGSRLPVLLLVANVLASAVKRDIIFSFANANLLTVFWSEEILKETQKALAQIFHKRGLDTELASVQSSKIVKKIVERFPDSSAHINLNAIPNFPLPDENDRHVVVAAIQWNADFLVTENLKDFPSTTLDTLDINNKLTAINSDTLIVKTLQTNTFDCLKAIKEIRDRLRNPPMSAENLL